jgi:hypothetical protein
VALARFDREVSRVCDDAREFLELIKLIQLRASFSLPPLTVLIAFGFQ